MVGWFEGGKLNFQKEKEWAKRFNTKKVLNEAGTLVKLGTYWLDHKGRREYEAVAVDPEGDAVLPGNVLNIWRGFGVEPRQGDWCLMQEHIRNVLASGDVAAEKYILDWAAWAAQNPGKRADAVLVLKGREGTGKGLFLNALAEIFGSHGVRVTTVEGLTGKFNAPLQDALFVFADEISWSPRGDEDKLKALITEPTIQIERKGHDRFPVTNRLKVTMAANADRPIPVGPNARRYAIFNVSDRYAFNGDCPAKDREAYFKALCEERDSGGLEAMLYALQHRDLKGFHPRQVPTTAASGYLARLRSAPPEALPCLALIDLIEQR